MLKTIYISLIIKIFLVFDVNYKFTPIELTTLDY